MIIRSVIVETNFHIFIHLFYFSEILSQKQKYNKMSPQNIAIVMSPNLLWAPETIESDYLQKVNSTAAVNAIVESIVSDWSYFFPDEFSIGDFYVTLTRDELFPDNGGFPLHRDPPERELAPPIDGMNLMTKSMHAGLGIGGMVSNEGGRSLLVSDHQTHSRSSSHDTSLILLCGGDDTIKRSQSNSSLSDSSPPQQNSPKLPLRRKHNKQVAPTPPDTRFGRTNDGHPPSGYSLARSMTESKERFFRGTQNDDDVGYNASSGSTYMARPPVQQTTPIKHRHGSSENLFTKPDKPPRPAMPAVESQTLIRNAFKAKGLDKNGKPVALPRSLLNVARSTENLSTVGTSPTSGGHNQMGGSDSSDELEPVLLREIHKLTTNESNRLDKPAIPERPTSLLRSSCRAPLIDKFEAQINDHSGVKKTQSFRMSGTPSNGQKVLGSGSAGRSLTTLERTHIYNVDKQQVEIIDVNDSNNGNGNGNGNGKSTPAKPKDPIGITSCASPSNATAHDETKSKDTKADIKSNSNEKLTKDEIKLSTSSSLEAQSGSCENLPPASPRGPQIKRPQIPAPPPPKLANPHSGSVTNLTSSNESAEATAAVANDTVVNSQSSPNLPPAAVAPPVTNNAGDSTKL